MRKGKKKKKRKRKTRGSGEEGGWGKERERGGKQAGEGVAKHFCCVGFSNKEPKKNFHGFYTIIVLHVIIIWNLRIPHRFILIFIVSHLFIFS